MYQQYVLEWVHTERKGMASKTADDNEYFHIHALSLCTGLVDIYKTGTWDIFDLIASSTTEYTNEGPLKS